MREAYLFQEKRFFGDKILGAPNLFWKYVFNELPNGPVNCIEIRFRYIL